MASYFSLEDSEGLKAMIDKKALDLFQSRDQESPTTGEQMS